MCLEYTDQLIFSTDEDLGISWSDCKQQTPLSRQMSDDSGTESPGLYDLLCGDSQFRYDAEWETDSIMSDGGEPITRFVYPRSRLHSANSEAYSRKDSVSGDSGIGSDDIEPDIENSWSESTFLASKPLKVNFTNDIQVKSLNDGTLQINHFLLEPHSDLGSGSFCCFKLASSTLDAGLYAMKTISKRRIRKNELLFKKSNNPYQNIKREIDILTQLHHPNIVKLFDVFDDPKEDAMIMVFEYMDLGPIMHVPSEKVFEEAVAVRYLRDILNAVQYLHDKQIVHRDLKPENILCNSFGRVKLCDFGLSIQLEDDDDTTMLPYGTPAYTAPECLDEEVLGHSAKMMEMYAVGITLFALLFGYVPFVDDNVSMLYEKIQKDPLKLPAKPHISFDLRDLLTGLLAKDPKNRLTLAEVLACKLFSDKQEQSQPSQQQTSDRCTNCVHYNPSTCRPLIYSAD